MCTKSRADARTFDSIRHAVALVGQLPTRAARGNANRVAVILTLGSGPLVNATDIVFIGQYQDDFNAVPLASISGAHPYILLRLEDIGPALFDTLYVQQTGAGNVTVYVIEVLKTGASD